jgi:sterol desaturase/sphingolipid hydroxylase (fatty acid hydroxylase superfamily)
VTVDLTVAAIPGYFGTMGAEHAWLRRRAETQGPSASDYTPNDTFASLAMGVASLVVPLAAERILRPFVPGKGRFGKALVATAVVAAAVTTVADRYNRSRRRKWRRVSESAARVGGVTTVVAGGLAVTTTLATRTMPKRMWERRVLPDLGAGPLALLAAVFAWDFVYYWNHRFMHTSRYMWAIHVVHHSSEHYNLSTALRQPVADALGTYVPYGALALFGIRPELIKTARDLNLLYQYWIHTDTIRRLGRFETAFNTPSHHRVHHGSNKEYLDRNHGSILIVWDKLFGTFEPERERVVYGLTKNINTYNPARIASHEHRDMLRGVANADNWSDRLQHLVRGPAWEPERATA